MATLNGLFPKQSKSTTINRLSFRVHYKQKVSLAYLLPTVQITQ